MRIRHHDVGCWVLKTRTPPAALVPTWSVGETVSVERCVHPTYRLGLVRPGDRCLLWLSGSVGPGVQALGLVSAGPRERDPDPSVHVRLHRLAEPLPRAELLASPEVAGAEVLRAPFGSNPSYLTPGQLRPVLDLIDPADLHAAGWG